MASMTPKDIKEARLKLGLTQTQLGILLGYKGENIRQQMQDLETGKKDLREPQKRLIIAYLEGYKPKDWPL